MSDCIVETTEKKSVLHRSYNYRQKTHNSGNGYFKRKWQAHHILCHHALAEKHRKDFDNNEKYIEKCLRITEWDLNNNDNLIGLPVNKAFKDSASDNMVNFPELCSHQVDHNTNGGYTEECISYLQENVWKTLHKQRIPHEVNAKSIAEELKMATQHFATQLKIRAERNGGTIVCWNKRHNPDMEFKWYFPFSMAEDLQVNKRNHGSSDGRLTGIFNKIKVSL